MNQLDIDQNKIIQAYWSRSHYLYKFLKNHSQNIFTGEDLAKEIVKIEDRFPIILGKDPK